MYHYKTTQIKLTAYAECWEVKTNPVSNYTSLELESSLL